MATTLKLIFFLAISCLVYGQNAYTYDSHFTLAAESEIGNISSLRRAAVRDAWAEERQLVQETGQGTRNWTEAETEQLLQDGKVAQFYDREGRVIDKTAPRVPAPNI
jgi:hypothetical protein